MTIIKDFFTGQTTTMRWAKHDSSTLNCCHSFPTLPHQPIGTFIKKLDYMVIKANEAFRLIDSENY